MQSFFNQNNKIKDIYNKEANFCTTYIHLMLPTRTQVTCDLLYRLSHNKLQIILLIDIKQKLEEIYFLYKIIPSSFIVETPGIHTILFRNWLSRKCVATWAGNRLNSILLFECCNASMSLFSSLAWICHRKSNLAVHSTCLPCKKTAKTNIKISTTLTTWSGITELEGKLKGVKFGRYYVHITYLTLIS